MTVNILNYSNSFVSPIVYSNNNDNNNINNNNNNNTFISRLFPIVQKRFTEGKIYFKTTN